MDTSSNPDVTNAGSARNGNLVEQIDAILKDRIRGLRFPAAIEQRFNGDVAERRRRHHAVMAVLGCLLYDSFLIGDAQMIPDIFGLAVVVRLGIVTPLIIMVVYANWRMRLGSDFIEKVSGIVVVATTATLLFFMLKTKSPNASHYYVGLPLILIYSNTVQRIRFRYALVASIATLVVAGAGLTMIGIISLAVKQTLFLVILSTCILTLTALYRIEYDERYTYLLRLREEHLGRHDALTDLPNRRALEEYLAGALRQAPGATSSLYLMFLDLDHFKLVNDSCGHAAGDRLLCEIVKVWRTQLRPDDFMARVGGDEFAVVLRDMPEHTARRIGEQLIAISEGFRFVHGDNTFTIGLSVGLVMLDDGEHSPTDLFIQADMACHAAKQMGRGRLSQYGAENAEVVFVKHIVDWGPRIRRALDEGRFRLFLQRIVDGNGATEGYEALIRLVDEQGKVVSPGEFLPPAKRLGLMTAIDRWVCSEVFAQLQGPTPPQGYISVNLMPSSISDAQFANWLLAELREHTALAGRLRFEIIETEQLRIAAAELELFRTLHELGFGIYLDDFGAGYNSFELVKRLPLDGIKLDGTVVRDYLTDAVDQALVQAAVSIARRLGLKLVAEGVENKFIHEALKTIGVHNFQGYLFHRPEPIQSVCERDAAIAKGVPSDSGRQQQIALAAQRSILQG